MLHISSYSVRMRESTDQKNSEDGHFSRSGKKTVKTWDINYFLQGTSNIEPDPGKIKGNGKIK